MIESLVFFIPPILFWCIAWWVHKKRTSKKKSNSTTISLLIIIVYLGLIPFKYVFGQTYLRNQNFEGTGYDNSETWTEVGTPDPDYTTSPAPLRGAQSLFLNGTDNITSTAFTAQDSLHIYGIFRYTIPAASMSTSIPFIYVRTATVSLVRVFLQKTPATWSIECGTSSSNISSGRTWDTSTTFYIWVDYIKGTGTNAIARIWISTNGVKPSTPDHTITNGTSTAQTDRIILATGSNQEMIKDWILIDDAVIGTLIPQVTSFTPTSGLVGSEIEITGTGFTSIMGITLGGVAVTESTVNDATSITMTVPEGAVTGKIVVTNADGSGTSTDDFTVLSATTTGKFKDKHKQFKNFIER